MYSSLRFRFRLWKSLALTELSCVVLIPDFALEADEAYVLRHANAYKHSNPNESRKTRRMPIIAALIRHPLEGLILFDTGAAEDIENFIPLRPLTFLHQQHDLVPFKFASVFLFSDGTVSAMREDGGEVEVRAPGRPVSSLAKNQNH
jgi:hypothetical protein